MRSSLSIAALLFAVGVAAGLHGYSISAWHRVLDGSPENEVLLGKARRIRGDDWTVQIPLALAQREHDPPYPRVNRLIGLGQDVTLPVALPILHPLALFRPATWGFFLGSDAGLAWSWWCAFFGILVSWTGVAWCIAGRRPALAWSAGALVLLAPVVQLWSLSAAPFLTFAGLAVFAALWIRDAPGTWQLAWGGALLAWAAAGFALGFYPPFQIAIGWVAVAVVSAHWLAGRKAGVARRAQRAVALAALAIAVAASAGVAASIWDSIARMAATVYPGARLVEGGQLPFWMVFAANLAPPQRFANDSEALRSAGSLLFFPVLGAAELLRIVRRRGRLDPLVIALLAVLIGLILHAFVSIPEWLRDATLLSRVPGNRVRVALCAADALLLARVVSRPAEAATPRAECAAIALLWMLALAACAVGMHRDHPDLGVAATGAMIAANGATAWALLRRWRPALLLAALAAASGAMSLWWNPLVLGGTDYLSSNWISQEITTLDREAGGHSLWVSYGSPALGNLFRAIGVRALGGVQPIPQLELWERLDPSGRQRAIYDRFAHVRFQFGPDEVPEIALWRVDGVAVHVAPWSRALACLGVTHVLIDGRGGNAPLGFLEQPGFHRIAMRDGLAFFRLDRAVSSEACAALGVRGIVR